MSAFMFGFQMLSSLQECFVRKSVLSGCTRFDPGPVVIMAEELVDIVILGASGFTGKHVIGELLKFVNEPNSAQPRKIAIAGRCRKKLAAALTWASSTQDSSLTASVRIFEADVGNSESLISLCKKTKVLISCVGPYRKFGKPVVEACVQTGVDYLDVTGEPEFMEEMEFLYHEKAMQTGRWLISAFRIN